MSNRVVGIAAVFSLIVVLLGATLIIVTRGKGQGGGTNKKQTASEPITLTIWRTFDDQTTFTQSIQNYALDHPNVKINYIKKDLADYEVQLLNALAAGTGPDIASLNNGWISRHADKLIPLPTDYFKSHSKTETRSNVDFYKAAFAPVASVDNIIDNKVYGMPLYIDTLAIYVNSDLWTKARTEYRKQNQDNPNFDDSLFRKPPAVWNDLQSEIPYLIKKDARGAITQAGIALGTSNNVNFAPDMLSLLMLQNNTIMVDEGQKQARFNTFQNDATGNPIYTGTSALDFYTSFARADKSTYSWNAGLPDALQSFMDGKLVMYVGYQYVAQVLKESAPTLQYEIFPMPQVKGGQTINYGSYWTETVTNNSRHSDAAWDFVTYMASRPYLYVNSSKRSLAIISDSRQDDVFNKQVMTATDWPRGRQPEKIAEIFNAMIDNVVLKKQPLQATIDNAASETSAVLQKE